MRPGLGRNDSDSTPPTRRASWVVAALVAGIALAGLGGQSLAQSKPSAADAPPVNWNGIWVLAGSFMDKQDGTFVAAPGRAGENDEPATAEPKLKGEYLAKQIALRKAEAAGKPTNDSGAQCIPQGMPRFWHGPYAFEILQTPLQMNVYQEWNQQTRRIYLDGRSHNPDADPSYNGHSIGHWQGHELLVDTAQIREDSGLGLGNAHSDQIHITERFKQVGPDLLQVDMTVTDPKALAEPWVSTYRLRRKAGMEIQEYVCDDNNRNTVDANGVTQAVIAPK